MKKTIDTIKLISLILASVQFVLLIAFFVFYSFNIFSLKDILDPIFVLIFSALFVCADAIYIIVITAKISSLRQHNDLKAADIVGNDIQEAYNFALLGLVVTGDDDVIIWTNDLFNQRHLEIIDTNIFVWQPNLASLKDSNNPEASIKLNISGRDYEVKYLNAAGLWIFKDISEYESLYKYSRSQAPVVGVIAIDNYDDVVRGEDDFNDLVSKVKSVIFAYAKEYGILLRKVKDNNYSLLCNYESFMQMREDHFSLIDKAREMSHGEDIPLTLSIGIAHDFPDVIKLNDLANEALGIAMSRGGDQVVVQAYGQDMEFFGGKTQAQEKRNRVKTRVLADSLIALLKTNNNILIMGHANMDMDAFGACLAIQAICHHLEKKSYIVIDFKNVELKTRSAITATFSKDELEDFILSSKEAEDLINPDTLVVVVDVHTSNMVMSPQVLEKCSKTVVIDHHRRAEDYIDNFVYNHIDASASSTCEILAEFIHYASINPPIYVPSSYATFMLSGIFLDSSYFKSKSTGMRTFEAATFLKEYGADNSLADDYLKDDYEEHQAVNSLLVNLEYPHNGIVIAYGSEDTLYDSATIAKAANECLTFKGVHAVFAIGKTGKDEARISARSDGSINVQILAERLGGGGHFTASAVAFDNTSISEIRESLKNTLEYHLKDALKDNVIIKGEDY